MQQANRLSGPRVGARSGKARHLVVFLHGVGADGNDLISLADEFAEELPDAEFVSPNAPFPCDMAPYGYQWFSLQDRNMDVMLAGVRAVEPILNAFVDAELERLGISEDNLAFVGFSQGTMTALHTILRRPKPCAGILGYSGALLAGALLAQEIKSRPRVCLVHGDNDMVVPYMMMGDAASWLAENKIPVEYHTRPGLGHGIDLQGIRIGVDFLKESFRSKAKAA